MMIVTTGQRQSATYHGLKEWRVSDVGGFLVPGVELRVRNVQRVPALVALLHPGHRHKAQAISEQQQAVVHWVVCFIA